MWLQQAESRYHLVLPKVVDKTAKVLPERERICLRRDLRLLVEKVAGEAIEGEGGQSLAATAAASISLEELEQG